MLSRAQPSPVEGLGHSNEESSRTDTPQELGQIPLSLTQEQRHSLRQQMGKQDSPPKNWEPRVDALELSADKLKELQEKDNTVEDTGGSRWAS